ncbi:unnamed protein product [Rotaria sp. Silwood1]|nr:unnamed protein product [Rotaria sp. Silwood1]
MYNTDHRRHLDGYCLLYSVNNKDLSPDTLIYQLIPYCLRPREENLFNFNSTVTFDSDFTFSTLREKNISSQQLLSWSASIDLAERYQVFLNNISHSLSTFKKEDVFYNCLWPWFGPLCQFSFDPPANISFDRIVARNFPPETVIVPDTRITCYKHLDCNTSLPCLDWREICNIIIDAFNKLTLKYRASWIFPVRFPFLPVHRLAIRLIVPPSTFGPHKSCTPSCIHGQCFTYVNDQSSTFCRCESGWTGFQCNIPFTCNCAFDSLCVDRSTCVCPINRFGPRCYLSQSSCHYESCDNDGRCVSNDERHARLQQKQAVCSCSEVFSGGYCEIRNIRIDISFDNKLTIPQLITVYFITTQPVSKAIQMSTMKRIPFNQDEVTVYSSLPFNIAFAQIFNEYYLIALREQNISVNISTKIIPSNRCSFIRELFNETFRNFSLLRLVKYYHVPCRERSKLVCFYDKYRFCLCDLSNQANCFKFDPYQNYSCRGYNLCENGGQCIEDNQKCPTSLICVCPECYYGSKCQFNTHGSILSLDVILGNQIRLNTVIHNQPTVVKVTVLFTVILFVLGFINSFFSLLTFKMKLTRDVGCGNYLFLISIISMITMCVLAIKVAFLLASQIGSLTNRSFLYMQCISVDFFLRLVLSIGDWLSACVSIERTINISKGVNFNKEKSKHIVKWIVLIVVLFTGCTHIHDPIHRRLIDDDEERTWCLARYSSSLQRFDRIVNTVHLTIPFAINFISALIIIVLGARIRSKTQKNKSYKQLLFKQLQLHKHLLISQCFLLLLAVPRLILSFLSGCMKSIRNPWLYVIGYFISFVPQIFTFLVFILPSKLYMEELHKSIESFFRH